MGKIAANDKNDRRLMFMKNFDPRGCLPLPRVNIHAYNHYFQTASSLKQLGESKPKIPVEPELEGGTKVCKSQRTNGPVNAHLVSWPSKAQNIHNLENIW